MVKFVFGGGAFQAARAFNTVEQVSEIIDILTANGVKNVDSAQIYGESELLLGEANATSRLTVDTKHCGGFIPGQSSTEQVVARGKESLKRLKTNQVDIFYLHAPERNSPVKDTLAGVDQLYKAGAFKRFGISNFTAEEVEEVVSVAKANGFVQPSVYQGNYSPVARKQETRLFPTLRKHNIAFYAYSPQAGGFLSKTKEQLANSKGRWDEKNAVGQLYHSLYNRPALVQALDLWEQISTKSGISRAELAYRWTAFNSDLNDIYGDAVIFSASSTAQLHETLAGLKKGPLSEDVVKQIDAVWETVKDESPLDNFNKSL